MGNYADLLKDPRWQKKRLEILSRDEWACQWCQDTENTLHVHHLDYEFDRKPWDYPDEYLITLCEKCHLYETENRKTNEAGLLKAIRLAGFDAYALRRLGVFFRTPHRYIPDVVTEALLKIATDREFHCQFFDLYFDSLAKENAMRNEKPPKKRKRKKNISVEDLDDTWREWVTAVKGEREDLGTFLDECDLVQGKSGSLLIYCPTDIHLGVVKDNREYLENFVEAITGQSWKIATN